MLKIDKKYKSIGCGEKCFGINSINGMKGFSGEVDGIRFSYNPYFADGDILSENKEEMKKVKEEVVMFMKNYITLKDM